MEEQQNYLPQEEPIDIRKFLITILKNFYWFAISIFITYIIAFLINRYTDPIYRVNSTIIINDERKSTAEILINVLDRSGARKNVENEIAIIKSYRIANLTLSQLNEFDISYYSIGRVQKSFLYKTAPFKVITDTSKSNLKGIPIYITVLSDKKYIIDFDNSGKSAKELRFGEPYIDKNYNFTLFYNDNPKVIYKTGKFYFIINDKNALARAYQGKLNINTNDKRGTVLNLSTTGFDPQMETDYLNKLMEIYIQYGLDEKNQTAINTINFIDDQLSTVVDSLKRAEDKLQNFRLKNKVLDISSEGTSIMSRLENIQNEKAELDLKFRYFKYLQGYIDKKKDFRDVAAPSVLGITDPLLNSLISELSKLYSERSILVLSAQQGNPELTLINAKIQNNLDALKENIKEIITSNNIALAETNNRIDNVQKEIQQLPVTERGLLNIERNFKLNDQIYNFLLQKRADAAIAKASNVADNKILDQAQVESSEKIAPKTARNKMIALVIGILIPLSIIILIEYFNDKIMDPRDIEKITRVPILGTIGHNDKVSEITVADNPKSALSESFRALRTNLQYVLHGSDKKMICITSTISGEGKTFCAVNLAAIIAQSNKKTLLISLDLRKPKIHKIFNVENDKGLSTYLIGNSEYEDIVIKTNINQLYITPAGPVPPNPAELIETSRMKDFIDLVKKDFDVIIMDTPPIAIVTDALLLTKFSDAVVFVVRQNYSTQDVANLIDDLHFKKGVPNLGILINDIKIKSFYGYNQKYSYYGYGYGYNYNYGADYYDDAPRKTTFTDRLIGLFSAKK
jgi:capsular exopolysaccharide synthesis family protein